MWNVYKNLSGKSGVERYDYNEYFYQWIKIEFTDGSIYTYTDDSCGLYMVMRMVDLAESGYGLNRFINDNDPEYSDVTR